ncbi:unnamed protein product [Polarella glacialis]|uniref:Uncharacterized protein n=1 Tax=Polarella glacialis TaxID=89957 RepID=A0A813FQE3_POLGL|nr:unnamed protein product [Polarella glacialis]
MDALDGPQDRLTSDSGLQELFRTRACREAQQSYLDLYKQLDNFVKFLSMASNYRHLANIAGDAGMYHLRTRLHHLLQEIELCLVQISQGVSRLMREVRKTVTDITLGDPKPAGRQLLWLERLQLIDEGALGRCFKSLLEALQELRYLSSEARLPELQDSCKRSLNQISEITASAEFRSRCAEVPPIAQLADGPARLGLEDEDQVQGEVAELTSQTAPAAWSVERHFPLRPQEATAMRSRGLGQLLDRHRRFSSLGEAVEALNSEAEAAESDFCVVCCGPLGSGLQEPPADAELDSNEVDRCNEGDYACLFRPGGREAAQEALSLESLNAWSSMEAKLDSEGQLTRLSLAPLAISEAQEGAQEVVQEVHQADIDAVTERSSHQTEAAQPPPAERENVRGKVCSEEEQGRFYELLFGAVLPLLGDGTSLSGAQAISLLQRSGMEERDLVDVLAAEATDPEEPVDRDTLRRLLGLVAHVQAGCQGEELKAARNCVPECVPSLRGLNWDGRRLRILEPLV